MNLYLLRHGEAENPGPADFSRQLTSRGRRDILNVATQFALRNLLVDSCLVSPYVRAQQTAEVFLPMIFQPLQGQTEDILKPEVRAVEVMNFLASRQEESILIVSHNPLLSELNALLTEGNITSMTILGTSELVSISLNIMGLGMGTTQFRLLPDVSLAGDMHS